MSLQPTSYDWPTLPKTIRRVCRLMWHARVFTFGLSEDWAEENACAECQYNSRFLRTLDRWHLSAKASACVRHVIAVFCLVSVAYSSVWDLIIQRNFGGAVKRVIGCVVMRQIEFERRVMFGIRRKACGDAENVDVVRWSVMWSAYTRLRPNGCLYVRYKCPNRPNFPIRCAHNSKLW